MVTTDGSSSSIKLNSQLFDGSSDVYSFKISSSSSHIIYRPVQDQALVTDLYSVQLEIII